MRGEMRLVPMIVVATMTEKNVAFFPRLARTGGGEIGRKTGLRRLFA